MKQPLSLPQSETLSVSERYRAELAELAPQLLAVGNRLLERISTPNWILEWSLPRWLGNRFDLPPQVVETVVLSNVYGLATVRLQDDLVDGELAEDSVPEAVLLSAALHVLWMRAYRRLFAAQSPFWEQFESLWAQWLRATLSSLEPPSTGFQEWSDDDFLALAGRGGPLKACCLAACLLSGQHALVAPLVATVDHLLVAAVLLDQAKDWTADLEAGRYNVFVDYASPHPQPTHRLEADRRRVLAEVCLGDGARAYFDRLRKHLRLALEQAQPAGCDELTGYLSSFEHDVATLHECLADEARKWLSAMTDRLFGSAGSVHPEVLVEGGFHVGP